MAVNLLFSFDTEDYETPASDDAELWWANLLARYGVRGNFCVVAEEARAVRRRGRRDVLDAWSRHEIASHSSFHSAHPTPAEYLDDLAALAQAGVYGPAAGMAEGLARLPYWEGTVMAFMAQEGPGLVEVANALGQYPTAWCKPGNSWGPQICAALPRLGVPVFCDAPLEWAPGQPLRYDGALLLRYHTSFDRYFGDPTDRVARMRADFLDLLARHRAAAEAARALAPDGRTPDAWICLYTHPCRLVTASFPRNFTAGRNPPREEWEPAPTRPREEIASLQHDFEQFVRWLVEESGVEPATYTDLARAYAEPPAPWLGRQELPALCAGAADDAARLGLSQSPGVATGERAIPRQAAGQWLSPAEQLGTLAAAAGYVGRDGATLPDHGVAVRRLLGPSEPPTANAEAATVPLRALLDAARWTDEHCERWGAIPARIPVGAGWLGPQALLGALRVVVGAGLAGESLPEQVPVAADPGEVAFALRADSARLRYHQTWSIFPPEFTGERLLQAHRAQCWTVKPAVQAS